MESNVCLYFGDGFQDLAAPEACPELCQHAPLCPTFRKVYSRTNLRFIPAPFLVHYSLIFLVKTYGPEKRALHSRWEASTEPPPYVCLTSPRAEVMIEPSLPATGS